MKKQVCIRTYPQGYLTTTEYLDEYLEKGYTVVMSNNFYAKNGYTGNEYILEKEGDTDEQNDR